VSEKCVLKSNDQKIESISQLVNIIIHEVQEGKMILEIVALVKEKVIIEEVKTEMENAISSLTTNICNAKGVNKEELLDTLEKRNIVIQSDDAALLTLITAIEMSSIQCSDVTPIISSTLFDDTNEVNFIKDIGKTDIQEETGVNISVYPHVMDHAVVPKFKMEPENIKPSKMSLDRNHTQVWCKILDCFHGFEDTITFLLCFQFLQKILLYYFILYNTLLI